MSNGVKFIITALIIVAAAFAFKAYKSGAFDNVQPVKQEVEDSTQD